MYSFKTEKTTPTTTLNEIYRQHCELQLDELETVQKAQTLFPHCWERIFDLMNNTIKEKERKNGHC